MAEKSIAASWLLSSANCVASIGRTVGRVGPQSTPSKAINDFDAAKCDTPTPLQIAVIYKLRWEIELFFRWIKQHLRLRGFFATTPNGVAIQIWTALCAYLLVAITKHQLELPGGLHQILQVISISALEKVTLHQLFGKYDTMKEAPDAHIQFEINGY